MTRGVKVRLVAFIVLSAVGIVYVAGSYLGLVDRVLGRGLFIHATLPTSGGLFEGSEVTYRGHKVGQVKKMVVTPEGVKLSLGLKDGTKLPLDSPMFVHNLSAVGEQYLDFEPPRNEGPYAKNGDTIHGDADSLPVSEEALLTDLDSFVNSVDKEQLAVVVQELGTMFRDTANPLQRMVDSGNKFVDVAAANQDQTIALLNTGKTVLQTQADHERDIRTFATDLANLTESLRASDPSLRTLLEGGPATLKEVDALVKGLEPTMPVFLSNLITVNQVFTNNLPGLEQMLVTFPVVIASGFTGTPGDGYGHINLQLDNSVPPCTKGYLPKSKWRPGTTMSDGPVFPAKCLSGPPINMRGTKYAPAIGQRGSTGRNYRVSTYDPRTGATQTGDGRRVVMGSSGKNHTVFGDNSWQWMLMGSVKPGE